MFLFSSDKAIHKLSNTKTMSVITIKALFPKLLLEIRKFIILFMKTHFLLSFSLFQAHLLSNNRLKILVGYMQLVEKVDHLFS